MTSKNLSSEDNRLLVVGGLHVDDIAIPIDVLQVGVSNPVRWEQRIGGVGTNAARVAAKSVPTTLFSAVGEDALAESLIQAFDSESVSLQACRFPGVRTGRYTVVLNAEGELHIGLSAVTLAEALKADWVLSNFPSAAGGLLLDANLSPETLVSLTSHLSHSDKIKIIALPVSPARSVRLLPVAEHLDLLICNAQEARRLTGMESPSDVHRKLRQLKFSQVVITDSANPVTVLAVDNTHSIPVPPVSTIKQAVNGAGDALAGATVAAWLNGASLYDAVEQQGIAAALDVLNGNWCAPEIS